jgi:hypothetical protein
MLKTLENDTSGVWTEDHLWDGINALVTESTASRGKVITPLRHALTGRKVRFYLLCGDQRLTDGFLEWSLIACYHDGTGKGAMYREVKGGTECVGAGSEGNVGFAIAIMKYASMQTSTLGS